MVGVDVDDYILIVTAHLLIQFSSKVYRFSFLCTFGLRKDAIFAFDIDWKCKVLVSVPLCQSCSMASKLHVKDLLSWIVNS